MGIRYSSIPNEYKTDQETTDAFDAITSQCGDGFDGAGKRIGFFTGLAGQLGIEQLGGIGSAETLEAGLEPFLGDRFEWHEQVGFDLFVGVSEFALQKVQGEVMDDGGLSNPFEVYQGKVLGFADDATVYGNRGADQFWGKDHFVVGSKVAIEGIFGEVHPVALYPWKADFQAVSIGADGMDPDGVSGFLWGGDDRFGVEIKGDAKDIGVFDGEKALFVEFVGLSAQGPADHLFAQKLGAKGPHPKHMGDGVGIPTFGEHGDGDDTADLAPEGARFPHGVHDLAKEFGIGHFFAGTKVAGAFDFFPAKALDLEGEEVAELWVDGIA